MHRKNIESGFKKPERHDPLYKVNSPETAQVWINEPNVANTKKSNKKKCIYKNFQIEFR